MKFGRKKLWVALACLLSLLWLSGSALAVNLVINGGFESGNTGFTSEYDFSSDLEPEGTYAIGNNPHDYHDGWPSSVTPYEGVKMMIVNGAVDLDEEVWGQPVSNIVASTEYYFSTRVASIISENPATLAFYVDGVYKGELQASGGSNWELFYATWTSGTGTTANLALVNLNTATGGNDFCLDDIRMDTTNPVPLPPSVLLLGSGLLGLGVLRYRLKS